MYIPVLIIFKMIFCINSIQNWRKSLRFLSQHNDKIDVVKEMYGTYVAFYFLIYFTLYYISFALSHFYFGLFNMSYTFPYFPSPTSCFNVIYLFLLFNKFQSFSIYSSTISYMSIEGYSSKNKTTGILNSCLHLRTRGKNSLLQILGASRYPKGRTR